MELETFATFYKNQVYLDKETAAQRSKNISGLLNYKIIFVFEEKQNTFSVYQEVTFNLAENAFQGEKETDYFFIDYDSPITPAFVKVNDCLMSADDIKNNWTGIFLNLPKQHLLVGKENRIYIQMQNQFVSDGNGLYNFTDVDQKQYIYTHLEPNFCHKVFANFDQPDLKATFEISVVSPSNWVNIANGKQISQEKVSLEKINEQVKPVVPFNADSLIGKATLGDKNFTVFEKTVQFSTYIFFFGTGNFDFIELPQEKCYKGIPQRIYVRESLKHHLLKISDNIFELMNKLFPFYEQFFHCDFPWSKYDHIFCPDFNIGAMENVGAVTFNDSRIPRESQTVQQISSTLNVFAHELVHTWFGDLVTMFWWDDLWLKESFADFLSYYAISQINLSFEMSNQDMIFNSRKSWGIEADSKHSTHSIAGKVQNTEQAKSVFDGITYAKGAATLKQLMFVVGAENFSKAMGTYCQKYSFKTAMLEDLLACLQQQFSNPKFTLQEWYQQWLIDPGMNVIEPVFDPKSTSNSLTIKQSAFLAAFPTLRFHKIKVGFFNEEGNVDVQEIILDNKPESTLQYDSSKKYKAVLLNYGDQDFVKVKLDQHSLQFFSENFQKIKCPLEQKLIIRAMFELVSEGILSGEQFVQFTLKHYRNVKSDEIFESLINTTTSTLNEYTPSEKAAQLSQMLFTEFFTYLQSGTISSDNVAVVVRGLVITLGKSESAFQQLLQWYNEQDPKLVNQKMSVGNQWSFVELAHKQLDSVFALQQKNEIFAKQCGVDKSDTVLYETRTCQAILDIQGTDKQKQMDRWNLFLTSGESKYLIAAGLKGFNQSKFKENIQDFYNRYFSTDLITVFDNNSVTNASQFATLMFPTNQDFRWQLQQVNELIPRVSQKHHTLLRFLRDRVDILNNKIAVFEKLYNY